MPFNRSTLSTDAVPIQCCGVCKTGGGGRLCMLQTSTRVRGGSLALALSGGVAVAARVARACAPSPIAADQQYLEARAQPARWRRSP